ncbi:TetR/AcrR family transcriptional regulator [Bailinhaonella thermotolerans]|uniref:TetR/AcrR family transcriptional regulator n=1 Tax=Bailinhaonella thermotolerans TaxID=1070861 RepID=A0A3A4A928_9ACTN|nr:TetR/AcrR family transcriptional regulator [Bailinhaonella thermotolerans]RJL25105.1 TetR/AcrR family transcriptional regulator [Bailinhaonella thermotolerans]
MTENRQPATGAKRGRKRSEESRQAILGAAFELVDEVGYAALTIEGIAARAGCGKQTIYRWWPSKAHVLMEALAAEGELGVTTADHGSYAADLRAFLRDTFRLGGEPRIAGLLRVLIAEAQIDPRFGEVFRAGLLERRRDALRVVLDRAGERGDLPSRPAPDTVLDIVFGVLWYRLLAIPQPLDDALADDLTATLAPSAGGPA